MSRVKVKGQSKWAQVGEIPLLLPYFDPLLGRPEATETLGLSPDIEQGISNNKKKRKSWRVISETAEMWVFSLWLVAAHIALKVSHFTRTGGRFFPSH